MRLPGGRKHEPTGVGKDIGVKNALVCGGGFFASHIVQRLKREGFWVRRVDLKSPEFSETEADDFVIGDLCEQDIEEPFNVGSEEMASINQLVAMIMDIVGKKFEIEHIPGPLSVRERNSDNRLIKNTLGWTPSQPLTVGLEITYAWIEAQVARKQGGNRAPLTEPAWV
jgi:nucleoside-diphosphate-sugar epimerase